MKFLWKVFECIEGALEARSARRNARKYREYGNLMIEAALNQRIRRQCPQVGEITLTEALRHGKTS